MSTNGLGLGSSSLALISAQPSWPLACCSQLGQVSNVLGFSQLSGTVSSSDWLLPYQLPSRVWARHGARLQGGHSVPRCWWLALASPCGPRCRPPCFSRWFSARRPELMRRSGSHQAIAASTGLMTSRAPNGAAIGLKWKSAPVVSVKTLGRVAGFGTWWPGT